MEAESRTVAEPAAFILIALVLYQESAEESVSWQSLEAAFAEDPSLAQSISLLIYDNSAVEGHAPANCGTVRVHAVHDPRNLGLAEAYNHALAEANRTGCRWLLLLDQDTQVTAAYLREAVAAAGELDADERVSAIVPKLRSPGGIKSPTLDFLDWLRRQFRLRRRPLFAREDDYGLQQEQFSAFNSGSLLRCSTLRSIGGFARDFPLDFLDTTTFFALHRAGGRVFILHACLNHALSMDSEDFYKRSSALARHRAVIAATVRFVKQNGQRSDRWLHRYWLLRNALSLLGRTRDLRFSLASLTLAIRYR